MKEYLLGIDLGTSGTKTVLFRSDGTAMAAHTVEYPLYQPPERLGRAGAVRLVACCAGDGAGRAAQKAVWPPPMLPV